MAKRALEIAAAGGHNVLLIGAPGGGKTMMARRLAGILPALDFDEALDCTSVHSVAGTLPPGTALMHHRPFRAPHHTISEVAMVGGGSIPRPGEISLAHNGVLFLDELPEFDRRVLEALRQPLEEGRVIVSRAARTSSLPGSIHARRGDEPLPVRVPGRSAARMPLLGSRRSSVMRAGSQVRCAIESISLSKCRRLDRACETMAVRSGASRPPTSDCEWSRRASASGCDSATRARG